MSDDIPLTVTVHTGPSRGFCICNCPESCGHSWDGRLIFFDHGTTSTCSKCGMLAIEHFLPGYFYENI